MRFTPSALLLALAAGLALPLHAQADTASVVAPAAQQERDDQRRTILSKELATEKKSLEQSNLELAEAIKAQKTPDEVRAIAASALGHSNNIESLQRELDGLAGNKKQQPRQTPFVPGRIQEPAQQAPANVPYWDVYRRNQQTPPKVEGAPKQDPDLNDSPDAGDKEADSEPTQ